MISSWFILFPVPPQEPILGFQNACFCWLERICLGQKKKIADETRIKIEEENIKLKENIIKLENKMAVIRKTIQQDETRKKDILFIKLNAIYEKKCKKNFFNNLYVKNSENYKNCILNKGKIKKN